MAKKKQGASQDDTQFGRDLIAALKESMAHKKGRIVLSSRTIEPMSAARVKEIRKKVARSPKEFERKFGVPARTVEGWEQKKKIGVAERILLRVIEKDPEAVERALAP